MPHNTSSSVFLFFFSVSSCLVLAALFAVIVVDFTLAWSPSNAPTLYYQDNPQGIRFGDSPTTTQCCFSTTIYIYCLTDGTTRDRVRFQQFTRSPLTLWDEVKIDATDTYKLRGCAFAVVKNNNLAAAAYKTSNANELIILQLDPDGGMVITSGTSFPNCNIDSPNLGALFLDSNVLLATAGTNGIARIQTGAISWFPKMCEMISLIQNQQQPTPATPYGSIASITDNNKTFWVTDHGLFKYDANSNQVVNNITTVNATQQALASESPTGTIFFFTKKDTMTPVLSSTKIMHKVDVSVAKPVVLAQTVITQELVGFIYVDFVNALMYSAIRNPYFGVAVYDPTDFTLAPLLYDVTATSTQDPGALLPAGNAFFQSGNLPSIFPIFDVNTYNTYLFATPKTNTGVAASLRLPTLAVEFDAVALQRASNFVNRAGATSVASSAVGGGSFFIVLSSTPSTILMLNAEDLSWVQDGYQFSVLNSTDLETQLLDSICVYDETKYMLYVTGTYASTNGEPAWIASFNTTAGTLQYKESVILSSGKRQGVMVLADDGKTIYVCGATGTTDQVYIQHIDLSTGSMIVGSSQVITGQGSKVISATVDAAGGTLLLATDTNALVAVSIVGGVIAATAVTVRFDPGAQTLSADRFGFVTVGYSNPGAVDVVHVRSQTSYIDKQALQGTSSNVNILRATEDDNKLILGYSASIVPGQPPSSTIFAVTLDLVNSNTYPPTFGNPKTLGLSNPNALATLNGFTFVLGRDQYGNAVAIYHTGSRTEYAQHRQLTSNAKRSKLIMPNDNFTMMTRDQAAQLCANLNYNGLADFFDLTELDAMRGLFDQDPVWVAGRFNGMSWVWPSGSAPPDTWWAEGFPFQPWDITKMDTCVYVRQGKLFNGDCNLKMLPACAALFDPVSQNLVRDSVPPTPWIIMGSQTRTGSIGGVFGLRRVDFVANFFECVSQPWSTTIDWNCGAAWDTNIYGKPQDVQMVSYTKIFVSTLASLYEVDLVSASQNLIRQYNSFRRKMQILQKWNMTVVYGESRTDFFVSYGSGLRLNVWTLTNSEACDNVQFLESFSVLLCMTRQNIVQYSYWIDPKTFRLVLSNRQVSISATQLPQEVPIKFSTAGVTPYKGVLKVSIFGDLVSQDIAYNGSANASSVCEIIERECPFGTSTPNITKEPFTTFSAATVKSATVNQSCSSGNYQACLRIQIPLTRQGMSIDCSDAVGCVPSTKPFPVPSKTLGWVNQLLARVTQRNGQVSLDLGAGVYLPVDLPAVKFQMTSSALEDGLVTVAFTVQNFPCLSRASDFSSYCMSTISYPCNPNTHTCYETHAFGSVGFADACDVLRTCTATVITAFNANDYVSGNPDSIIQKMILNAATFSGKLDTLLQFNITGQPTSRVTTLDNRLAIFQALTNASRIEIDRATSWLQRDSPPRAFSYMHPTVATRSESATAASLMLDSETLFWKRSTELVLDPSGTTVYYAVGIFTDNIDELDNVVRCGATVKGIIRFAPYISNPAVTMPPMVVDSQAPGDLNPLVKVVSAVFQNSTGLVANFSNVNVSTGAFSLQVNCNVTMPLQMFLVFANGATASIPFYIIGKSVTGVAGAPPQIQTYPPLPSPIANEPTTSFSGVLASLNSATRVQSIQDSFNSALTPGSVPPNVTLFMKPEIGSFVVSDNCPKSLGNPRFVNGLDKNEVTLNLANPSTFKQLVDTCIAFQPSPALEYQNISYTNVGIRPIKASIGYQLSPGSSGSISLTLDQIPLKNAGPQVMLNPCNVTIVVGHQTIAEFGQVFKQPIGVNMVITPKIVYRGDSGNQQITVSCNATGFCWTFFETMAATTNFELTASDGYFYSSTVCGVYAEFVNLRVDTIPAIYSVHAGDPFTYSIPSNLFLSSSSWAITSVTEGSFALESGVSFQAPLMIVGSFKVDRIYNLTIVATNVFGSATGYIVFNSTNYVPQRASNYTYNKRALVFFTEELNLNTLVTDKNGDALKFTILDPGLLPKWLSSTVSPGGFTTSPQVLALQGTPSVEYSGATVTIYIQVEDSWESTELFVNIALKQEYLFAIPQTNVNAIIQEIHPGSDFSFEVNMSQFFNSSTAWNFHFTSEIFSDLKINGLAFTPPISGSTVGYVTGLLEGKDALQSRNITLVAKSPFDRAATVFIVVPINEAPNATSLAVPSNLPINLGTYHASHTMKIAVTVSNYFFDGDSDPLNFWVTTTSTADQWIVPFIVFAPDGYTTLPKTMTIDGTIPASAVNKNVTLKLFVSDKWNTTSIPLKIVIPQARKPVLIKPLPNYTVVPADSMSDTLALTPEYFMSPDGDQITVAIQVVKGASWVTTTLQGDVGAEKLTVAAAPTVVQDDEAEILVSVKNPFGNTTEATIYIEAQMTQWQRVYATAVLVISIASAAFGVLGLWAYWPMIIGFLKGSRVVVKCPLNATESPRYHFPEDTEEVKVLIREDKLRIIACFSHWLWNFFTLKASPRGQAPCYLKVYDKHISLRLDQDYDLDDPPHDAYIQFFNGSGVILQEFEANFREVMCVPSNIRTGIWKPKAMLFTSAVSEAGGAAIAPFEFGAELPPRENPIKGHQQQQRNNNNNNANNNNNNNTYVAPPVIMSPQHMQQPIMMYSPPPATSDMVEPQRRSSAVNISFSSPAPVAAFSDVGGIEMEVQPTQYQQQQPFSNLYHHQQQQQQPMNYSPAGKKDLVFDDDEDL